jgi:prepilin-type N-terminal cleavage/methylation domain-containing protein
MSGCSDKNVRSGRIFADNKGFSLTELVVVMGIFLTVMLITSSAFKTIANSSSQQSKLAETQIGGIVGLEVLRADLEQAGFGLPWAYQATPAGYQEAVGTPASAYNDAPPDAPRPITSGFNKTLFGTYTGSKYIVIKSTVIAPNATSKKWTNISFLGGVKTRKEWGDIHRDFAADDRVIIIKNNITTTPPSRQLVVSTKGTLVTPGTYSAPFSTYSTLLDQHLDGDTFQIYGIAPSTVTVKMPFNRSDYYLSIPSNPKDMPEYCATNTGVLYKATIKHADGYRDPMPLLDCVADLQIVYGLDTDGGGRVNFHTITAPSTAEEQRAQIKELRAYLLVQDGKKDLSFSYPNSTIAVGESFDGGATIAGRHFDLTSIPDYRNYRWKVYTIVVRPKNLIQ